MAAFQDHGDAQRFRVEVEDEERLAAFWLKVAPAKTRVLPFDGTVLLRPGRPTTRPQSFTFLGFTHFLTKTREGKLNIGRTPSRISRERFLRRAADWLRANRHLPVSDQQRHLGRALVGYDQYFGLRLCLDALKRVRYRTRRLWYRSLRRRSQKAKRTCDWATLNAKPWFQLPLPRVVHAWV